MGSIDVILTTQRLVLREFTIDDWRAVHTYQSDPRYRRYYGERDWSEAGTRAFVQRFVDNQVESPRHKFQLAITLPGSGTLIGNCGVRLDRPGAPVGDIGYELNPEYWGRGYATEAARAMLAFGFEELGLHRVWAECVADNVGSRRVLEKLGMTLEGRLRENQSIDGRWHDTLIYAILEQERTTGARRVLDQLKRRIRDL